METIRSLALDVWPYVVGFLTMVSVGDMVGWYQGWKCRRGFKVTAVVEDAGDGVAYQIRTTLALRGTAKRSINSVHPVVRPRSSLWRLLHGGWSVFGERSRGRPLRVAAVGTNPARGLVVDDPAPRRYVFEVAHPTDLPRRWNWPLDRRSDCRVPQPREVKLRCDLSDRGIVYVKPKRVRGPLGDGPVAGVVTTPA